MTGRAVQVTSVSPEVIAKDTTVVPYPPDQWFVRGPRGGLHIATGKRSRIVMQSLDDYFRDTWSVVDKSAGTRYVRPNTRLAKEAP